MWKLIVIYMTRHDIIEYGKDNEVKARQDFDQCEYNPFVHFAFLYNTKGNLEETYIGKHK